MNGFTRYSVILRLFSPERPDWTISEISEELATPTSTIYRTMRELAADGFVEASTESHYRLGSAFIEFDRMMRLTDPLVLLGTPLLDGFIDQVQLHCICVLARLYGDRVICAADARPEGTRIASSYERGRPMPLTRGATSKAILANVPIRRLNGLMRGGGQTSEDTDPKAMNALLQQIRRKGFCVTRGEVDDGLVGIAAPVANKGLAISASISLIVEAEQLTERIEQRLIFLVISASNILSEALITYAKEKEAGLAS